MSRNETCYNISNMRADYINPFLNATINLFDLTFNIDPQPGPPFLVDDSSKHRWEISGVMVLTGSAIGVVAIRLSRFLSSKLLEKSGLRIESEAEREELTTEMVGELVNIIAGNASSRLSDYNIKVSVPFVVQGENHSLSWPSNVPIIGIPFTTKHGPFLVNVSLFDKEKLPLKK